MYKLLEYEILENKVLSYLSVAVAILLALIFKRFLSRYIAGLLFRLVKRVARGVDKRNFVDLVIHPLEIFLVIAVTIISIEKLRFPEVLDIYVYKVGLQKVFETASIITLIISFSWLMLRIIDFIAMILEQKANVTQDLSDNQLVLFFKDFFKVLVVIFGLLLVLKLAFSFKITSLITGLSLAGAAIALATRESIENLIASFIIFFDKPFTIGDIVKVHNITGSVEKIGLRSTRLRTDQKTYVTVPNKQMVDSIMDNLSLRTQRRAFIQLEIHGQTATEPVNELIGGIDQVLRERKDKIESHSVFLSDINKNAFIITVEFFTATIPIVDFNALRQYVNLSIIRLMEQGNIRLASMEGEPLKEV